MSTTARNVTDRRGRAYTPAVGPRLRPLLWLVLGGFARLGANGVYLASVSAFTWWTRSDQQTFFSMLMVALHLALGLILLLPFLAFGFLHLFTSWKRPNRTAIRFGLMLLATALVLLGSGLVLLRLEVPLGSLGNVKLELRDPTVRAIGYWLHVLTPLLAIGLYVRHRLAGPRIRWGWAKGWGVAVAGFVVAMGLLHRHDPRDYNIRRSREGAIYTFPSSVQLVDGKLIPPETLMMDQYCLKCHKDAYDGWFHSSHHFSSFNNPAYLFSVRETRKVSVERDGSTRAARWCAGCHDPVPFFSGQFDDEKYDDVHDPTSQAGITCTSCHAITHVNSTRGNADYTIGEPQHYPFAYSDNAFLQWVNNTLVKAKPEMHKRTFLKPLHKDANFCSTCHKVGLPFALNHYRDFVRGQNHHDTFLLSGVSGGNARAFYYPPKAKAKCADCHMEYVASDDFGAKDFDGKPGREIHDHFFPAANTGLAALLDKPEVAARHAAYLADKKVRIDIFGLREGGSVDGRLIAPLRPEVPPVDPGKSYLVEVVIRTLGVGHPLTQGTADSNEVWVELTAKAGDRVIGRSGGVGPDGTIDPYAHFINVYMLDREGRRIDRRNPQDIFVPLYNKQVPPGAGQVVHFALDVPGAIAEPIRLEAKLHYRKFDRKYMDYVYGPGKGPELPVVLMAKDAVMLPIAGGPAAANEPSPIAEIWQRWNDYGIGLFLEGEDKGGSKGELRQAEEVFRQVAELGRSEGWVNLARVYQREGRIPDALEALKQAADHPEPGAPWTIAWLTGQVNERNGFLDEAIANYESVLATRIDERGFDFSRDYEVINALGMALFKRSRVEPFDSKERGDFLERAVLAYRKTLAIDGENVAAHYGLGLAYADLARGDRAGIEGGDAPAPTVTPEALVDGATRAADRSLPADERARASRELRRAIAGFLEGPRHPTSNRLDPLHEVWGRLAPAREDAGKSALSATLADTLATTHKSLHAMFKEDETARGRAQRIARQADPAADLNAQSIVIHPMHTDDAAGRSPVTAPTREPSE